MNIINLRFANININYDSDLVMSEIHSLNELYSCPCPATVFKDQWRIPIFSQEEIDNASYHCPDLGRTVEKKHPSWRGCALTHLEHVSSSIKGTVNSRNSNINNLWKWREDINIPYIKEVVNRLNFKTLHLIKVLILPESGIGLVHRDDIGHYYNNGGFSLTLNVSSGESPIVFLNNNKIYEAYPKQVHIFRDDCWHAIPVVKSERIQIRVHGEPDLDYLHSLIDNDTIVYI